MLPDIAHAPRIVSNYENIIPENLKKANSNCIIDPNDIACMLQDLSEYIKSRSPVTFLSELRSKLQVKYTVVKIHIQLCSCVVLH